MIQYWIAKITYNLTWIPWYLIFCFFLRYKIVYKNPHVKKLQGPLIIAANHSSWLDPFLLSGIFPIFSKAFPIRFATDYRFLYYIPTAIFARIYGSFGVKKSVGLEVVLEPAVKFLKQNQVVGIFPEGRRRHFGRPRKGRRGAAYLAIRAKSKILPVYIEGSIGINILNFLTRKKKVAINVGEPFVLPEFINNPENFDDLNEATEIIMDRIHKLNNMV